MNTSFSVAVILLRVYVHIIKPVKHKPDGCVPLILLSLHPFTAIFVPDIAVPASTTGKSLSVLNVPLF